VVKRWDGSIKDVQTRATTTNINQNCAKRYDAWLGELRDWHANAIHRNRGTCQTQFERDKKKRFERVETII